MNRAALLASATRCYHCGCEISDDLPANHPQKATADHLIPVVDGGPDTLENLVPSCLKCNLERGTKGVGWRDTAVSGYDDW